MTLERRRTVEQLRNAALEREASYSAQPFWRKPIKGTRNCTREVESPLEQEKPAEGFLQPRLGI